MSKTERKYFFKDFKGVAIDSGKTTSCLGINKFFNSQKFPIKFLWLISTIFSSVFCSYLVINSVIEYFSYNVVTKTTFHLKVPSPFPSVAICNINQFMTNYSVEFSNNFLNQDVSQFDPSSLSYFLGSNAKNPNRTDEERKKMGIPMEKMLLKCLFNLKPCNPDDFEWFYDIYFGNCYKFNTVKNGILRATSKPGKTHGLRLELFVGQPDAKFEHFSGAHVFINNASSNPIFYEGIDVSPGFQTNIGIRRVFIHQIPKPYSCCESNINNYDSNLVKAIINTNISYRQIDCFDLCWQTRLAEKCKCYDLSRQIVKYNLEPCLTLEQLNCTFKGYQEFLNENLFSQCYKDCPLECESTQYITSTSFANFPSNVYADYLISNNSYYQNFTRESLQKSILALNIFYEDLRYQLFEEKEKLLLVDLLAGVGGTISLFLGISFLSLCEFFDILIRIFYLIHEYKISKQKVKILS